MIWVGVRRVGEEGEAGVGSWGVTFVSGVGVLGGVWLREETLGYSCTSEHLHPLFLTILTLFSAVLSLFSPSSFTHSLPCMFYPSSVWQPPPF